MILYILHFPLFIAWKRSYIHIKLMINLLVYDLSIFSGNLVNDKFSNLKLNIFCSDKYGKQVVLINYSWISPTLQKSWRLEFCLFSKKRESVHFPQKRNRLVK